MEDDNLKNNQEDNTIYISPEILNLLNLESKKSQIVLKEYYSSL